jgi:predicted RNase H-like nuclease
VADGVVGIGVDGCRSGWIAAIGLSDTGSNAHGELRHFASFADLVRWREGLNEAPCVAVDMPIGLPRRTGFRACDREARARLGYPAMSSVFQPPDRELLRFAGFGFDDLRRFIDERRMAEPDARCASRQVFFLLDKLQQVDEAMRAHPARQEWLVEFHPEVSFMELARARLPPKRRRAGMAARKAALRAAFAGEVRWTDEKLPWPRSGVGLDDVYDAYAGLWTSLRFGGGGNGAGYDELGDGQRDEAGLRMRIVV